MKKKERNALEDAITDRTVALMDLQADPHAIPADIEKQDKELRQLEQEYREKWVEN